jgi:hypothetical protein
MNEDPQAELEAVPETTPAPSQPYSPPVLEELGDYSARIGDGPPIGSI